MPDKYNRTFFIPLVVFVILLITSVAGWKSARDTIDSQSLVRFEVEVDYLHSQIETRFDTYAQVLRGGVGLFNGSESVSRDEWHNYVDGLKFPRYFPGIRGIGFSAWVGEKAKLAAHEKQVRAEGFPAYAVRPVDDRDVYTSIMYIEPLNELSRKALGFDMFSEGTRRAAMQMARDTGEPALSGKVQFFPGAGGEKLSGSVLYAPVYKSEKGKPDSVAARRATLTGFVFSPFVADELMKGILKAGLSNISFQVYDDSAFNAESMLYDGAVQLGLEPASVPAQYETSKTLIIAGRKWYISYSSTPSFTKATDSALPWTLLTTGILFSLLISIVAWMLLTTRVRVTQRTNELRKQSEINSVLLENLAEGVIACDADVNVILFNKKAREWYQLDSEEEPDLDWSKRVQMFEKDGITAIVPGNSPLIRAVAGSAILSEEICIVAQGQEPRFVLVTGGPLPISDNQKQGALLSLRDITDYRNAMMNIERQQHFLNDVIDNIPNLISARDREGKYVLANRAYAESIYGLSSKQLLTASAEGMKDNSPLDDNEKLENIFIIDRGTRLKVVRQACLLDEQQRWFSIGKLPILSNKNSDKIVLTVAADITDLKLSEERVRTMNQELENRVKARTTSLECANRQLEEARQVAESANLAKSSFLAVMSHEIRTPMNGVVGMVEVLLNETRDSDFKKSLQMVLHSAFSLLGIIDDILDFSKIEAGHFELENVASNLTELVETVVRASVPMARKVNCTVTLYIDPEIPEQVLLDETRFRQVLTNLVGNAIKFSGKQADREGHVEVRASVLHADPLTLQLDVIDNGVGMSADTQTHIFESFLQAESSITRRFGGSGLGLAICKRIVDMMHGEIIVDSQLGEGSRFTVILPLDIQPGKVGNTDLDNIKGVNCILVDSDRYHSADIATYLQAANANVHEAVDMQAAATMINDMDRPAVILCTATNLQQTNSFSKTSADHDIAHVVLSREENTMGLDIKRVSMMDGVNNQHISAVVVDNNALRRKSLIEAVEIAIGRASPAVMHAYAEEQVVPTTLVPLSVEAAMAAGSCILVVEDDSVNRMVIERQLRLLGQTAVFAENGREALQKWRSGNYRLVFTDLHMPIMDGYTMTRAIRQEEPEGVHLTIVALTANALSGEPRRAANAGVDGYLTKPLQLNVLREAIDRYLVPKKEIDPQPTTGLQEQSTLASEDITDFDPDALRQLLGDDKEIIIECLEEFLVSLNVIGHNLVGSIKCEDWVSVDQLAHRLKSSSLSTGALEVWKLCMSIESARVSANLRLLDSYADEMAFAIARADVAINRFIADDGSGTPIRKAS